MEYVDKVCSNVEGYLVKGKREPHTQSRNKKKGINHTNPNYTKPLKKLLL